MFKGSLAITGVKGPVLVRMELVLVQQPGEKDWLYPQKMPSLGVMSALPCASTPPLALRCWLVIIRKLSVEGRFASSLRPRHSQVEREESRMRNPQMT